MERADRSRAALAQVRAWMADDIVWAERLPGLPEIVEGYTWFVDPGALRPHVFSRTLSRLTAADRDALFDELAVACPRAGCHDFQAN